MRLVLDTNVLIAAVVAEGLCRDIVRRRVKAHILVTSQALLDELANTLRDKFGVEPSELALLAALRDRADMAQPTPLSSPVCRDADDDMVLATAVAGQAEVIVSGDADLLTLGAYEGIRILSPRQFVEMLDAQA
jgi:putative PIN family toxin of toxin-antitoxin system